MIDAKGFLEEYQLRHKLSFNLKEHQMYLPSFFLILFITRPLQPSLSPSKILEPIPRIEFVIKLTSLESKISCFFFKNINLVLGAPGSERRTYRLKPENEQPFQGTHPEANVVRHPSFLRCGLPTGLPSRCN